MVTFVPFVIPLPYTYWPTWIVPGLTIELIVIVVVVKAVAVATAYEYTAKEYDDKKSLGQARYGLLVLTFPVTFLRKEGNCTELKIRSSACLTKVGMLALNVDSKFSV
jgi:hypothetical protein